MVRQAAAIPAAFDVVGPISEQRTIAVGGRIRALAAIVAAEVHWYEAAGIGRRNLKIKRYLDR